MTATNGSSPRVSDVGRVVGEIAFQANLLALNAAIEAVGAGKAAGDSAADAEAGHAALIARCIARSGMDGARVRADNRECGD